MVEDPQYAMFLSWYRGQLINWIDVYTDPKTSDAHRSIMIRGFGLSHILNTIEHSEYGLLAIANGDLDKISREVALEYSGYEPLF